MIKVSEDAKRARQQQEDAARAARERHPHGCDIRLGQNIRSKGFCLTHKRAVEDCEREFGS